MNGEAFFKLSRISFIITYCFQKGNFLPAFTESKPAGESVKILYRPVISPLINFQCIQLHPAPVYFYHLNGMGSRRQAVCAVNNLLGKIG